jgi:hypothetical protein
VDYFPAYRRGFPLAANAAYKAGVDGAQQAKQYAEMIGLKFAFVVRKVSPNPYADGTKAPVLNVVSRCARGR